MRWSQGVTARRIARELGGGISRSAVLGKIHRLGFAELSPRAWVHRSQLKRARARRMSPQLLAALGRTFAGQHWPPPAWVIEAKPYVEDPRVDADIPLAQRRTLLELTRGACRWPVGDPSHPDFFFCGAEALRGERYCAAHRARAYRPAAETISGAASPRRRRTVRRDQCLDTGTTARRRIADDSQRSGGEMSKQSRQSDPDVMKAIREHDEPPAVEQSALPTPERIRRAGADFERGDTGRITMRDSPLERARARELITHQQYAVGQKYRHHWYYAGLADQLQSIDVERIFAADRTYCFGMPKTEAQLFHRQRYREATQAVGKIGSHVLDWVVCREAPFDQIGYTLGWGSRPQAYAAAVERMKTALDELSKLWGLVR